MQTRRQQAAAQKREAERQSAATATAYLASLPADIRALLEAVRASDVLRDKGQQ